MSPMRVRGMRGEAIESKPQRAISQALRPKWRHLGSERSSHRVSSLVVQDVLVSGIGKEYGKIESGRASMGASPIRCSSDMTTRS
jgi:hypothetical protein